MRRRARIGGHPVVVQLIGQGQVESAGLPRPSGRGKPVIDQFGVPGPGGLDPVGLVTRPRYIRLATLEFGQE